VGKGEDVRYSERLHGATKVEDNVRKGIEFLYCIENNCMRQRQRQLDISLEALRVDREGLTE